MKNRILFLILGLMASVGVFAQNNFHRTYPTTTDDNFQLLDGVVDGQNTFVLSTLMPDIPGESEALFLSAFDYKGNEVWVRKIDLADVEQILDFGELILAANDSLYFTALLDVDDASPYRIIGSYDKSGRMGSIRKMTDSVDTRGQILGYHLADHISNNYLTATVTEREDTTGFILTKESYDTNTVWSHVYHAFDTLGNNYHAATRNIATFLEDSTITVSGNILNGAESNSFVAKLDTNGQLIWSKSYAFAGSPVFSLTDLVENMDSTFLVSGSLAGDGFIMALDSIGNPLWSKQISLGDTTNTFINHIAVNANGHIVAAGTAMSTNNDSLFSYMLFLDGAGNIITHKRYNRTRTFQNLNGELIADDNGNSFLFGTSSEYGENINVPEIIKVDGLGESMCADTLLELIISDLIIDTDTLIFSVTEVDITYEVIEADDLTPLVLDIPTLTLASMIFCPDDPIDFTFDPDVQGAIEYLWSDGSTADTLRVFAEGEYSVTVTVDENICFMMCDTGKISVYKEPAILVQPDFSAFCTDGTGRLRLNYMGEAPLSTINWSTGASDVNSIVLNQDGQYSVTATDICMETADTSINIQMPRLITDISTELNEDFCLNNGILLGVSADAQAATYQWSNAATTVSTVVDLPGIYTVTVTDICGNPFSESIEVDPDLIKTISNVQINPSGPDICVINNLELTVSFTGSPGDVLWNTGDESQTINVTAPGTYSVVVTDDCGDTKLASVDVTECPEALEYPKVFFPRGEEELNKRFGPTILIDTGEEITNYEFKVYNRWGQLVFETTNLSEEWDGNHNGSPAPSGVYVYYAKYSIGGEDERLLEGDITLLR